MQTGFPKKGKTDSTLCTSQSLLYGTCVLPTLMYLSVWAEMSKAKKLRAKIIVLPNCSHVRIKQMKNHVFF